VRTDGSLVAVDYRLHRTAEAWKVFDVLVDGISYVRTYHDDVDSDVNQRGLDFAIARLERASSGAPTR
jgi:phospholipid transport system substrate-binding protein